MSEFTHMVESYFKEDMELSPLWASDMGLEEFDGLMPEGGREEIEKSRAHDARFLESVLSFQEKDLGADEKIDKAVLEYYLNLDKFRFEELALWRRRPGAPDTVGSALYTVLTRESTPQETRLSQVMRKMKKIPLYLERSKEVLDRPVWIWVEMAIESCHRMAGFIDFVEEFGKNVTADRGVREELQLDAINVRNAFKSYEQWLYQLLPSAEKDYTMSPEKYEELLSRRLIPYSSSQILEIGEDYVKKLNEKMKTVARKIDPAATVREVLDRIKNGHAATFESIMADTKEIMHRARQFVIDSGFATVPSAEVLEIHETPIFMRHLIPFAAYSPPGKFDKVQKGIYLMTPVEGNTERLMEFCPEDLLSTSVHEAYPGHHLQFACANLNPSVARLYAHATEFVEGWAHYCEDAIVEAGFEDTPQFMMIRLKDMLWRAWRIVIDVKLATGRISFEEAVHHLVEDAGLDHLGALAEVKRYTYTPGYQLSYLMGKHMILELRDTLKSKYPSVFDGRVFHDGLLYGGSLPVMMHGRLLDEKFSSMEKGDK